jgi:hypothetical protein
MRKYEDITFEIWFLFYKGASFAKNISMKLKQKFLWLSVRNLNACMDGGVEKSRREKSKILDSRDASVSFGCERAECQVARLASGECGASVQI